VQHANFPNKIILLLHTPIFIVVTQAIISVIS